VRSRTDERTIVGLMAGNSLDGIDGAVLATSGVSTGRSVDFRAYRHHPVPNELRETLFAMHYPGTFTANDLLRVHLGFAEELARAALGALDEARVGPEDVAVLGVQGANLIHAIGGRDEAMTVTGHMEVGELAVVAERTGIIVVGDLRPSDVALGGEGAPLSSYVDFLLFGSLDGRARAIQNLGGIANVTYLPEDCRLDQVLSFDCGPANMVIDRLIARFTGGRELYDEDGARAARGTPNEALLRRMLAHPYLALPPPKTSRGPEDFGEPFVDWLLAEAAPLGLDEDSILATATQYSVECMARHYERFFPALPDEVVLTGGGAHNRTLVQGMRERLPSCAIRFHDEFGIPVDAREASTWAILADETIHGVPGTAPSATGAMGRSVLGKIVIPSRLAGSVRVTTRGA
jgi:anhydro-N-acetylmuramic acid kinase